MPLQNAEAFVLRTYALKESDKIVSFFTREFGKRRGVARGARRPKSRFGSSLEPLTQVRLQYFEREGKDLSNLDHCELLTTMVEAIGSGLVTSVVVSVMVEVLDRLLPDHEANDAMYRLVRVVTDDLRAHTETGAWLAVTYFLYWTVRLGGYLPNLSACCDCGGSFPAHDTANFDRLHPGLVCRNCRRGASQELGGGGRTLAVSIQGQGLAAIDAESRQLAAGLSGRQLRQFLQQRLEDHLEGSLHSWAMLNALESGS